jgi:hypothetical protein
MGKTAKSPNEKNDDSLPAKGGGGTNSTNWPLRTHPPRKKEENVTGQRLSI